MTKKILFVSALSAELKIIKGEIKKLNISKNDLEINFFECGMGNYKTILNLTSFLENNNFDFIINIWVCWYKEKKEDIIQVSRIFNLANSKELISPIFFEFWKIESISCSEKIIYDEKEVLEENFVDMESFWFELVCSKYNILRMILKIPVDKIGEETKKFDFTKAKKLLKENINYEKLILEIQKYFSSQQHYALEEKENKLKEKIFKNYTFTFSEKIILEKNINKILVLELFDLEEFFLENKNLVKKEFLEKINKKL